MEIWDIYDKNRCKTGEIMERGGSFNDGAFHLVVHVCIFNTQGEMLIQQRQPFKDGWPNMWDVTVGGSAIAGDSSQSAAQRELFEEIGYEMNLNNVLPHLTINFEVGFDDYYIVVQDVDIKKLNLQYEEVKQVKWATKGEILTMIDTGEFIPYYAGLIELIFNMKNKYGAHTH